MKRNQIGPKEKTCQFRFRWAALLGLGLALTGCGDPAAPVSGSAAPATSANGPEAPIVTVYIWDQYLSPSLMEDFKKRTGIEVVPKIYESTDEMVEGLKSDPGAYDVFLCEDGYIQILAGKRLMKELDHSKLKNFGNIAEPYQNPVFDPKNQYTVPYLWGTTLLAYRKDKLPNPRHSWSIIKDEQLNGKVSFLNAGMECYDVVLRIMGIDLQSATASQIETAADTMVGMVRDRGLRFGDDNEAKDYLLRGDAWVSMIYSGDAALIAEANPEVPIGYFIPDEGAILWTDSFCISRDSERIENAYKFLDFMLEAESAARSANELHYASPNRAAAPLLSEELLSDEAIYPRPEVLARCSYFNIKDMDSKRMVNVGWRRVMDAWFALSGQVNNGTKEPIGEIQNPSAVPVPN